MTDTRFISVAKVADMSWIHVECCLRIPISIHLRAAPFNITIIQICAPTSWPGCSKLTTSLVNVSLKFQTLISQVRQYFLLKKCVKLWHCKSFSHFVNKKNSVYLVMK